MTIREARQPSLARQLEPLITREVTGIAAIDTAIAYESAPDYVVMYQGAKDRQAGERRTDGDARPD